MERPLEEIRDGQQQFDELKDWYNESDTDEDVPDPNNSAQRLFQDIDVLPVELTNQHFEEGIVYTMTLAKQRKNPMLVMVMHTRLIDFKYRIFFVRGSRRKTYHQAGTSKVSRYDEVWRLAPRRELIITQDPSTIYVGQTLRFSYGMSDAFNTVLVTRITTKNF